MTIKTAYKQIKKRLHLLTDFYGQLFIPEIWWENKFGLYYCRPWTGHRL